MVLGCVGGGAASRPHAILDSGNGRIHRSRITPGTPRAMDFLLPFHIAAGGVALAAGALALTVRKGGRIHRRSGLWFVATMLVMGLTGAAIAAAHASAALVLAGLGIGVVSVAWGIDVMASHGASAAEPVP